MDIRRICPLPELLANQIAAGEVIERPASVLKELVENSLDAGAKHIDVELERGGMDLITVLDDGTGICREDLTLALTRHATSKIYTFQDLNTVSSLGFRGEGLASIASVTQLDLVSRRSTDEHAWSIHAGDGVLGEILPTAGGVGTCIHIRELFFNVPARRKFLKSVSTEFSHCEMVMRRLALVHPHVAFSLKHRNKNIWSFPVQNKEERIIQVMGHVLGRKYRYVETSHDNMHVQAWLSHPHDGQSQREHQYFFVNGRFVRDKHMQHLMKRVYQDISHHQLHPVWCVDLRCPPEDVDVNVHPNKMEVRFRDQQKLYRCMQQPFMDALHVRLLDDVPKDADHIPQQTKMPSNQPIIQKNIESSYKDTSFFNEHKKSDTPITKSTHALWPDQIKQEVQKSPTEAKKQHQEMGGAWPSRITYASQETEPASPKQVREALHFYQTACAKDEQHSRPLGEALAQLTGTFILAQSQQGLVVVDIHAAHERIVYERLKNNYLNEGGLPVQELLLPITLYLEDDQCIHLERLSHYGLKLVAEDTATKRYLIQTIPCWLDPKSAVKLVQMILEDLEYNPEHQSNPSLLLSCLAKMSCYAAVRSGDRLTLQEMDQLLRDIEETERGGQCNHGRPTWKCLSYKEIDDFFIRGK